jgi:DNA-binding transcriptional LysR family regulator
MASKKATTENLFAVLALYERGSYGAAADALERDSGTVRYHLAAAREAYGDDVLVYGKGKWQATATGQRVLEIARKARALHEDLHGIDAVRPEGSTGEDAA